MFLIAQTSSPPSLQVGLDAPTAEAVSWLFYALLFHLCMFLLLKFFWW
jgi:hypothetical protein